MTALAESILNIVGETPHAIVPLHGGCIGEVYKITFQEHPPLVVKAVVKTGGESASLETEARMLRYLSEHSPLPVPKVLHGSAQLLAMTFLPGESRFSDRAQRHAAELFSALHHLKSDAFGFEYDTLIGALPQPNPKTARWIEFFTQHRLLHMAHAAYKENRLSAALLKRIETFCARCDEWLEEPDHPALLHGDAWTTNMLANESKMTGFLDPAIYHGHPEMDLAFTTLFGTFTDNSPFFAHYQELNPGWDSAGFFDLRRDLCNLYPLLVHVRLFGGSYTADIERTLKRVGC